MVKSVAFKKHKYIGDPINAVRIFSTLKADELLILDIGATTKKTFIDTNLIRLIGEEANMPFGVGGGLKNLDQIKACIAAGAEKVVIGSAAALKPHFIKEASDNFGSSTISVCIDVKKNFWGKTSVWIENGKRNTGLDPISLAKKMEKMGAGELIVQSITNDGQMSGFDLELTMSISEAVNIPVVALGGAGTNAHILEVRSKGRASAIAAGSMFVYHGSNRGVLINYPAHKEIRF